MIDDLINDYRQVVLPQQFTEFDMGCGRGGFTLKLAQRFPERLIVASDVMSGRLHKVDNKVQRHHLTNVLCLRSESGSAAEYQLPCHCIDRLHLLCPDPWPKDKGKARRLVSTAFLCMLPRIIKPGGILHLATDHAPYFEDWKQMTSALPFLTPAPEAIADIADLKTDFELQWAEQGIPTQHLAFTVQL